MGSRFSTLSQYHRIVLAHGVVAALVFLLIVPGSVMMARFYSRQPGHAVVYHAQLHVLAGLMLLAVFILGFFAVGPNRSLSNPHHGIGVAILVLFILQLVGGRLVRHITKIRSLRVMIHQWSGRAIALLGIVQVPLGLTLYGSPRYLFILYALWMVFLLLAYFVLSYRSAGRRELYMSGARSEAGRTRMTESENFSTDPKPRTDGWTRWLGPLAAGAGIWSLMQKRDKGQRRDTSRSRSRARSRSYSRSRGPEVIPSRRGSESHVSEKYSEMTPPRNQGGGMMKALGGAVAGLGAGKLFSGFTNRRQNRRDEEYSAVSTETPRRQRFGRGAPTMSEFSSDYNEDYGPNPRAVTNTTLLPPSANPPPVAQDRSGVDDGDMRRPVTPRPMHARDSVGGDYDESDYSSCLSPSRRPAKDGPGGGFAKGILAGLGGGWFAKKMADRRARREEERLREEEEMRSGTQGPRYTGDGYPSPTRRNTRRSPHRRPDPGPSEITESSVVSHPAAGSHGVPMARPAPGGHSRSRPANPQDLSRPEVEGSQIPAGGRPRRGSPWRRTKASDRAAAAAAARAGSLAADEERSHLDNRERYGSPQSQPLSVKLKVHDDRDRNVTLRRLTEEEALATRGQRGRGDSMSSLSGLEAPGQGRRYRRDESQQRRMERAAERAAERAVEEKDQLAPLSPPHPAFAKGARRNKDSAYFSGQPGPSGAAAAAGQTISSLGSPDSHGTWSQMSLSPSGPGNAPDSAGADDRRRRRRQERRAATSTASRPSGQDMFE